MLLTHLVPGYFLAQSAQTRYPTEVRRWRRGLMWATAFTFTVLPDSEVIDNICLLFPAQTLSTRLISGFGRSAEESLRPMR